MRKTEVKTKILSNVRRAAALKSVEVRQKRAAMKEPTTTVGCTKSDAVKIRKIANSNNATMVEAVSKCVQAYEAIK